MLLLFNFENAVSLTLDFAHLSAEGWEKMQMEMIQRMQWEDRTNLISSSSNLNVKMSDLMVKNNNSYLQP